MEGFDPAHSFGAEVARSYDDGLRGDEDDAVEFLFDLAGDGPLLEFAIGTGRLALPLAARGVRVDGIELSPDMVARLREKPGGDRLTVTVGDLATTELDGTYMLVYLVFNTIFNVLTQDDQVRCFENAARHLDDDGAFVVETAVPQAWTKQYDYVNPERIGMNEVALDVCHYDPVTQLLEENHVVLSNAGIRFSPIVCRLASPSELDLMARIAGLRLQSRWGGWRNQRFDSRCDSHVSVYRKATGALTQDR
jgi:Methyltransferase domain